jgi:hypothetical protein
VAKRISRPNFLFNFITIPFVFKIILASDLRTCKSLNEEFSLYNAKLIFVRIKETNWYKEIRNEKDNCFNGTRFTFWLFYL